MPLTTSVHSGHASVCLCSSVHPLSIHLSVHPLFIHLSVRLTIYLLFWLPLSWSNLLILLDFSNLAPALQGLIENISTGVF